MTITFSFRIIMQLIRSPVTCQLKNRVDYTNFYSRVNSMACGNLDSVALVNNRCIMFIALGGEIILGRSRHVHTSSSVYISTRYA